MKEITVLLLSLLATAKAFYNSSDDVIQLTDASFNQEVLKSNDLWLVEFYAPWCRFCKSLAPEWKKAATSLKGKVKVGAVDVTKNNALASQYKISGIPTVKIFGLNKTGSTENLGSREASGIVAAALKALEKMIKEKQAGKINADTMNKPRRFHLKTMLSSRSNTPFDSTYY